MSKARRDGARGSRGAGAGADFAETLTTLIESHNSSAKALAGALRIDVSLVYKWLRRERTPALKSAHSEAIARFLRLDTGERVALRLAQERSLRQGRPRTSVPRRVMAQIAHIVSRKDDSPAEFDAGRRTPALAPDEQVLDNREDVQQAVLNVIGGALTINTRPETRPCTLFCTFQGEELGPFDDGQGARWQEAMRHALSNDWHIEHIWRLTRDLQRSVLMVASTLDLLGAGDYQPLYITGAETLSPPYDLVIGPDVAVVMLATGNAANVDAALITHDEKQIGLWRGHYMQLHALAHRPLQRYLPHQSTEFGHFLTKSEQELPGRDFVKYGLSLFTEPASWSHAGSHWAQLIRAQGFDVARFIEYRIRRLATFQRHVRTAVYRDICPEQAIATMVKTGRYLGNGEREPVVQVPERERREHLANAIRVVSEHENYHLALVPDEVLDRVSISPKTFWEVLAGKLALLNTPTRAATGRVAAMDVVITEPQIAAAFQYYFDRLWERIPPLNRDKRYVIWWLERQLENVPA